QRTERDEEVCAAAAAREQDALGQSGPRRIAVAPHPVGIAGLRGLVACPGRVLTPRREERPRGVLGELREVEPFDLPRRERERTARAEGRELRGAPGERGSGDR